MKLQYLIFTLLLGACGEIASTTLVNDCIALATRLKLTANIGEEMCELKDSDVVYYVSPKDARAALYGIDLQEQVQARPRIRACQEKCVKGDAGLNLACQVKCE